MRPTFPAVALGVLAALCGLTLAAAAPNQPAPSSPPAGPAPAAADRPPADPALTLIQGKCTGCHEADFIFQTRRPAAAWGDIVTDMVSRGADLSEAETAQVRAYLEKNWSLPTPPA
jgi:mono/diheme cytochrome c family protein